jgi:multiple sugar transport system permease protein
MKLKIKKSEIASGYLFIGPAILILGIFVILPVFYAFLLSLHKVQLLGEAQYKFIGLSNFIRMARDEQLWIALKNTVQYVIFVVPTQTVLALILAVLLNTKIKGKKIFRILYFLPTITSSAVLTLIFMWIYNANGLLNAFLAFLGFSTYNWLGDPSVALKAIMLMNIWATAPFFMIVYLAALQDVPEALYEAATIDGANAWEKFIYITLPFLQPVTFFVVIMGIIGTFQLFDQSYIFSGGSGGPNNSTLTVVLLIYQYAFKSLDMGYAAAIAFMLAIVIILVTLIQQKLFKEETYY